MQHTLQLYSTASRNDARLEWWLFRTLFCKAEFERFTEYRTLVQIRQRTLVSAIGVDTKEAIKGEMSCGGCGDRIVIALVNNNTVGIELIEKSVLSYPWLGKRAI